MSVFEKIGGIQASIMSDQLPPTITAQCIAASQSEKRGTAQGKPTLKLDLVLDDKRTFSIVYNIPKSLTGKGQLDKFLEQCKKLKIKPEEIVGKRCEWTRMKLEGSVQGFDRFYPTKLLGQKGL